MEELKKSTGAILIIFMTLSSADAGIDATIDRALTYLYNRSQDNVGEHGEFVLYESSSQNMSNPQYKQIFFGTPFVYHALMFSNASDNRVNAMKNDALGFVQRHEEVDLYDDPNVYGNDVGGRIWRYYYGTDIPKDIYGRVMPYAVPDMDDTAMALLTLYEAGYDVSSTTTYFAKYQLRDSFKKHSTTVPDVQLKYNTFNTWIHEQNENHATEWEAYDVVTNANVLLYYGAQKDSDKTSEVSGYINYTITKMNENRQNAIFPYSWTGNDTVTRVYPSQFSFTYLVSKAYKDGNIPDAVLNISGIKEYMFADDDKDGNPDRQKLDGSWGNFEMINGRKILVTNDLETAMAALTLLNIYSTSALSSDVKKYAEKLLNSSINYLINNQNTDGSWDIAFWFWNEPQNLYTGSPELTTALALEALQKSKTMG